MAISLKIPLVLVDDDDLVRVSRENPGYRFEREEDGTLTVGPNFTVGGAQSGKAYYQLFVCASRAGGMAFDSSAGFRIGARGAVKSPDASWVAELTERVALSGLHWSPRGPESSFTYRRYDTPTVSSKRISFVGAKPICS
jgi:hypothetical protein